MPASPNQHTEGPLRVTVKAAGHALPERTPLMSVTVRHEVNRVPQATLVFHDGATPEGTFPVSDSATLLPGIEVHVEAGWGDDVETVFSGIVVRHGLRISGHHDARLVVECRDKAVAMTVGRQSAHYAEHTDRDVIETLIGNHGLTADVAPTTPVHRDLVQYDCTDWDYLLARAGINGLLVTVNDGTVSVKPPTLSGAAVLTVTYGQDLIDFQADLDAHIRGRARFAGCTLAKVGALVELAGVGDRFNGNVLVTGVTHEISDGDWTTSVEFGQPITGVTASHDVIAPPPLRLTPGIDGLQVGRVVKLDGDPDGEHRIQVKVPMHGIEAVWARLMQFHAGNMSGALFVPEIDDEVVLGWFNNDPNQPVVLGSLYSSRRAPATALTAENNTKSIVTRAKSKLEFDDDKKAITLETPGRNALVISDDAKSIVLTDHTGNTITMGEAGITLDSPKDIVIKATGTITLDATGVLTAKSAADVMIEGLNVAATAQVGLTAKGNVTAELSASGETTVRGAMVMIN